MGTCKKARLEPPTPNLGGVGPFTEQERYSFDLQGFVVRRGVLDADGLAEIHHVIDDLDLPTPGADIASQRFSGFLKSEVFRTLMDHEAVPQSVVELCGPTVRLDHCYGIIMSPGTSGLGLHGGAVPHDPAQSYHVHDGQMDWSQSNGHLSITQRELVGSVVFPVVTRPTLRYRNHTIHRLSSTLNFARET